MKPNTNKYIVEWVRSFLSIYYSTSGRKFDVWNDLILMDAIANYCFVHEENEWQPNRQKLYHRFCFIREAGVSNNDICSLAI